jgi:hypothetical protein
MMKLFTLIHLAPNEKSLHNSGAVNTFEEQIKLYVACARQLFYSLASEGIPLAIVTNQKARLDKYLTENEMEIVELDFTLQVPTGIKFYSAHFKIEVYKYLTSLKEPYVGLIDSDLICINKMPSSLLEIIEKRRPLYYDITSQRAYAYGIDQLIADKQKVMGTASCGLWAGGEFITGTPAFFAKLYGGVMEMIGRYFANAPSLHHQGDEVLTSAALENMLFKGEEQPLEAGSLMLIGRYWSGNTLHKQSPFMAYSKHFLLHLPADKHYLAKLGASAPKDKVFLSSYKKYLLKISYKRIFRFAKPLLSRFKKLV